MNLSNQKSKYSKMVILTALALPVIIYLWAILKFTVNMPYWDDYDSILNWINRFVIHHNNLKYVLSMLLEQHNEHRILFDRIFVLLDYYLFGSINFLYLNFVGYFGLFALFGLMLWLGIKNSLNSMELLQIPFFMFTLSQYELISFAMASMQQYWQFLFSLTAIILISWEDHIKVNHIMFSLLFAIMASFTGAGGLIVFPVILLYLIIYKKDLKNTIIWLSVAVLTFVFYFIILKYHQTPIGVESHKYAIEHPLNYIEYIFCFLGGVAGNKVNSFICGLVLFLFALFLSIRFYKKNPTLILFFLFIFSTAAAAGLSRVSLGVTEAISSRYTIYPAILLVSLYILSVSQIKSVFYKHTLFIISLLISIALFIYWIPKGIASLKNKDSLLKSSLVYPSEERAINIMETSVKLSTFMPIAQLYNYLPSYYAITRKLNQTTLYTIESISLNNTKPLYNLSYNIQTSASKNAPLPLHNNQVVQIVLPNGLPQGTINGVSIFQGNYNNTANGILKIKVCSNNNCSQGEKALSQSTDNSFFMVPLNKPLLISKAPLVITMQLTDSTKPDAIWLWAPLKNLPQIITIDGKILPDNAVKLNFIYSEPNNIRVSIEKSSNENSLQISGWAVDSIAKNEDSGVIAVVDNKYFYPLRSGLKRLDVSSTFNNPNYEYSGFMGNVPVNNLTPGTHTLILWIINNQSTGYFESKPIKLIITNKER